MRLIASEMVLRESSLLPVHAVTALNAFHVAFKATRSDLTRLRGPRAARCRLSPASCPTS